jgi:hypothetical protein
MIFLREHPLRILAIPLITLWASAQLVQVVLAQSGADWSAPANVSAGIATTPPQGWGAVIAADRDGAVHATWPECSLDEDGCKSDTIYYSVWREGAWSQPIDILAAPVGEGVVTQSLTADPYGRLILVWMGNRGLNFSIADVAEAGSARGWTTTTLATQDAVRTSDLFIDESGVFHLVYIANDRVTMYSASEDAALNWTEPVVVYTEDRRDAAAMAPKVAADDNGFVSACWSITSEAANWGPVGVRFVNSTDGGTTWGPVQALVEDSGYGSCALLLDSEERLHAFWLGSGDIGGRYHRWSTDGGVSWTETQVVMAPGEITGFPGAPRLLEDSSGIVHVVFSGYGPAGEQIWHARWARQSWTRPLPISASLPHSEKSAATLLDGKYLHVIWLEYQSLDFWHSFADTDAPAVRAEIVPLPTALAIAPSPAQPPTAPATAPGSAIQETPTPRPQDTFDRSPAAGSDSGIVVLFSVAPVLLIVGGVVVYRLLRRR